MLTRNQLKHTRRNARTKRNRWLSRRGIHKQLRRRENRLASEAVAFRPLRGFLADLRDDPKPPEAAKPRAPHIQPRRGFIARLFRRGNA